MLTCRYNHLHDPLQVMTHSTTSGNSLSFDAIAEKWNGRLAMIGFVIGVATEFFTGQGILVQIGLFM